MNLPGHRIFDKQGEDSERQVDAVTVTVTNLNDYRLVTLTPIIMKCFERLVKDHITSVLLPSLDPAQFAYHPNRSTEDAISTALELSLELLKKKDTHV